MVNELIKEMLQNLCNEGVITPNQIIKEEYRKEIKTQEVAQ